MQLTRTFGPMLWQHRRLAAESYVFRGLAIALALAAPWPLKMIIDHVLSSHPLPGRLAILDDYRSPEGVVAAMAGAIVVIALLRAAAESRQANIGARLRERLNAQLRDRMLAHLQTLPPTSSSRTTLRI